jgi:hypothetical protein
MSKAKTQKTARKGTTATQAAARKGDAGSKAKTRQADLAVEEMSLAELTARVEKAEGFARQIRELFPNLTTLTTNERVHTTGRFREGESVALSGVLDAARLRPALFASLADQDDGHEPDRFETELIAERLERRDLLARVDVRLDPLAQQLTDTVLRLGEQSRPVLLSAYKIAKVVAETDPKLRQTIAKTIDFYAPKPAAKPATKPPAK